MATHTIEERLAALESEVNLLKQRQGNAKPWWQAIVGTFKDDPAYEEAMRYGREWRESFRPEPDQDTSS